VFLHCLGTVTTDQPDPADKPNEYRHIFTPSPTGKVPARQLALTDQDRLTLERGRPSSLENVPPRKASECFSPGERANG